MAEAGHQVDVQLSLTPAELVDAVAGAAALVIRSATRVTAEVLDAGRDLVAVGRAGVGLDNVDIEAATRRGVMVVNAPESNIVSAAEHAVALMLAQARNIPQSHAALIKGAVGSGPSGRASSCTARRSGSSGSATWAPWWLSAPPLRDAAHRI